MNFLKIYELGTNIKHDLKLEKLEKKLSFVFFPYTANSVVFTAVIIFLVGIFLSLMSSFISGFLTTTFFFLTLIISVIVYVYPFSIFYTNKVMEYSEEMLRAILHLSTYIQAGTSMEYAFLETEKNIEGILKKQFKEINTNLRRKTRTTLGEGINDYVPVWNEVNPQFVKGIRLLQLASLSNEEDKTRLIRETIQTIMLDYMTLGKRSAENLSKNTKMLIGGGIMLPVLSLLILPIIAVFLPGLVRPELIAFLYVILFPTVVLVATLSFASKRIQIDTIRLEDHKDYKPMPPIYIYIALAIIIILIIPAVPAIADVLRNPAGTIDSFLHFFLAWLFAAGIAIAVKVYSSLYTRKYRKIWKNIQEVEQDLPFVLQSFSTYYTLNTPFERVVDGVIYDYQELGFKEHPVVTAFTTLKNRIRTSKKSIRQIIKTEMKAILPSVKTRAIIGQIASFEEVSQDSAAKAARTVREQVINTYKLDDYIRTLLSETVGLIKITSSMLAPLLCAVAVVMTYAILKSTEFITDQLGAITSSLGSSDLSFELIDMTEVMSPIFLSAVIGVYLLEVVIILSLFQTQIEIGSDRFKIMESINENMFGFVIYSVLLFGGFFLLNHYLFGVILGM